MMSLSYFLTQESRLLIGHLSCRRLCRHDDIFWTEQTNGLLHDSNVHPLHPDRGPVLGVILDQKRCDTSPNNIRWVSRKKTKQNTLTILCHVYTEILIKMLSMTEFQCNWSHTWRAARAMLRIVSRCQLDFSSWQWIPRGLLALSWG